MPMQRACAWIDAQIGDFALVPWRGSPKDEGFWAALKALAELAHAGDVRTRAGDARGEGWVDHAWHEVGQGKVLQTVLEHDPRFLPVALTMVPFHLAGRRHDGVLAVIRDQLVHAELAAVEWTFVVPALDILGIDVSQAARARAREQSVLNRQLPVETLPQDAAYILAHECFYASHWGHVPPVAGATTAYLATTLPALVERGRIDADADLLAEVILAARCMGIPYEPRVLDVFAAAQAPAGNIVPPPRLDTRHRRFAHPTMSRTYHTTLAAIMAWAADIVAA